MGSKDIATLTGILKPSRSGSPVESIPNIAIFEEMKADSSPAASFSSLGFSVRIEWDDR